MEIIRIKTVLSIILIVITINTPIIARDSLDSLLQTLSETCTSLMKQRGWPSMSMAIVLDQKIVFSGAFGYADIENQIPATTKTIYRVGSITKLFSATMMMQLAERRKVNLEDPLIQYLPTYKPKYPVNTGPTTLRQLASHTSGLHVDAAQGFWHYFSNFQWIVSKGKGKIVWGVTKNDLLSTLDKVEIEYTPNRVPNYSNFGYQLLGIALESAANEPFEKYIKSNILNPLGMLDSDFSLNDEMKTRFAVGYTYLEPDFTRFISPGWELDILKYSGGLYSTPEDIARFISFQFRDQTINDPQILNGDGIRFMRTPQTLRSPQSDDTYCIGWATYDYQGQRVIAHAGGHWGFEAKVEVLPDLKFGVVIMTNCNYPQGYIGPEKELTKMIYEKFIPILEMKSSEQIMNPNKIDLNKYAGRYSVAGDYANAEVTVKDSTLYLSLSEKPDFNEAFLPTGLHRFCFAVDPGKNTMLRFNADGFGNIVSLEFLSFTFKKIEQ